MARLTDEDAIPPPIQASVEALAALATKVTRGEETTEEGSKGWEQVASKAKVVADGLRTEELRVTLGETSLLASSGALLRLSVLAGSEALSGRTELLRVVGNMCFDNDANRERAHTAAVPGTILELVSTTLGLQAVDSGSEATEQKSLTLDELKFLRAAVGALLNMSLKYEPIREELLTSESLSVLLAILDERTTTRRSVAPVYVVGSWATQPTADEQEWKTKIETSSTIVSWAMNILEELLSGDKDKFPDDGISSLASIILSVPSSPSSLSTSSLWTPDELSSHIDTDLELLTPAASLLESLSIDLASSKQEIAFALYAPPTTLLSRLFTFVESASAPTYWVRESDDPAAVEKAFGAIKSAVVRTIVESPNSDVVMEKLFGEQEEEGGKNWVVEKLVKWVEEDKEGREDLLICAAHMLAALGRKDEHCISLVHDYGLAAPLAKVAKDKIRLQFERATGGTRPGEVTQILFGVVSLLRHLSIPAANKTALGETDLIPSVSLLLQREIDIVSPLQNAVVGLLKHLTVNNVPNSLHFLGPPSNPSATSPTSPLDLVLALIPRTDDVRLRSEASRILVNVVRSLFATRPSTSSDLAAASPISPVVSLSTTPAGVSQLDQEEVLKRRGRPRVVVEGVVKALSEMVRLSEKYPMLINEGIVGLTLLAGSGGVGALLVLDALIAPHVPAAPAPTPAADSPIATSNPALPAPSRTTSLAVTPAGDPPCSLDMISTWLGLYSSSSLSPTPSHNTVRPEMIGNACALIITVVRGAQVAKVEKGKLDQVKVKLVGPLKGCTEKEEGNEVLKRTIGRAWEVVGGEE